MRLLDAIDRLKTSPQKGKRAPHKPLLLLYALTRQIQNPSAKFEFSHIEKPIEILLNEFWKPPLSGRQQVNQPFWRLQNDKIWEVRFDGNIREESDSVSITKLRKYKAVGCFTPDIIEEIKNNPDVVGMATQKLLDKYFPESLHHDIREKIGLDYETVPSVEEDKAKKTKRDNKFRENVLHAYGYSCAVCGFNLRIKTIPVGLEAAHIKWHRHGGPDTENNGLALCATHHKLLDSGVMTLSENYEILLSKWIFDPSGENSFIKEHHKREISLPMDSKHSPAMDYIHWHRKEVFKEPELVLT